MEEDTKTFIDKLHTIIIPLKMQIVSKMYEVKTFEEVELDIQLSNLKCNVEGPNIINEIKEILKKEQNGEDTKAAKTKKRAAGSFFQQIQQYLNDSDEDIEEKPEAQDSTKKDSYQINKPGGNAQMLTKIADAMNQKTTTIDKSLEIKMKLFTKLNQTYQKGLIKKDAASAEKTDGTDQKPDQAPLVADQQQQNPTVPKINLFAALGMSQPLGQV